MNAGIGFKSRIAPGPVTLRQCVIVADAAETMLKPSGDRPFLAWRLRELARFGVTDIVVVCPNLSGEAETALQALAAAAPRPMRLTTAPDLDSTAGLDRRVLKCDAARLFDGNLATALAAAAFDPLEGLSLQTLAGEPTGVAALSRDMLAASAPLSRRVLTAGRVLTAETAGQAGLAPRPALFLDRDGTINVDHGYVGARDRFEWIAGARDAIARATSLGWHVFIVTNQSGVARGLFDEAAVVALHDWLADEARRAGGTIDDVRFCSFHPEATIEKYRRESDWRKPAPGMLLDLIRAWELDPATCLLVGDQPRDVAAAEAAGIAGHLFSGPDLDAFLAPLLAPV